MKKLFSTISILAIITQLTSCTTADATLTFEDEQTNAIRAHFEDYANANLEGMMTRWSDELTVLTNDGSVGLSEVKEVIPLHHMLFSEIYFTSPIRMKMIFMQKQLHILIQNMDKTFYKWHAIKFYRKLSSLNE